MDLRPEACRDLLHYAPGRVVEFHTRTAGGFKPGEKWTVRETNCVRSQAIYGNGRHDNYGRGEKVSGRKVREIGICGLRAVA
jgi:hypothetical protein